VNLNRPTTALVASIAVSALLVASSAWAGAQQARVIEVTRTPQRVIEVRSAQEADKARFAYAVAQDFAFSPELRRVGSWRIRGGGMAGRALANAEELELTETQQQSIREAQREHRRNDIRRDADIEIAELELEEMMEADALDLDAIETHMRQIANLQVDERMANLRMDGTVRDLLTVEQLDQLDEMSPRTLFQLYGR